MPDATHFIIPGIVSHGGRKGHDCGGSFPPPVFLPNDLKSLTCDLNLLACQLIGLTRYPKLLARQLNSLASEPKLLPR
jgi:hypothetical protein